MYDYDYDENAAHTKAQVQHLVGGYFEYFNGGIVRLDCIATDWETKQLVVVYTEVSSADASTSCTDAEAKSYVRPLNLFFGFVQDKDGKLVTRFHYMGRSDVKPTTPNQSRTFK